VTALAIGPTLPAQPSEDKAESLADALRAAQQDIHRGIHKGSTNAFHKYNYASAEDMIVGARAVMLDHGLVASRGSWSLHELFGNVIAKMTMQLRHAPSGEMQTYETEYPVIPDKGRPLDKALNAALTTSMSYWLRDLLLIPRVDEEVDTRDDRDKPKPSLKDKLKATAKPACDDEEWMRKFDTAVIARGGDEAAATTLYTRITASEAFKKAYDADAAKAYAKLVGNVTEGKYDMEIGLSPAAA
jgi:hypothetical protein